MSFTKRHKSLDANVLQSVKKMRVWLLQQDNDPEQISKSTMNYFKKQQLKHLGRPHLLMAMTWSLKLCGEILNMLCVQDNLETCQNLRSGFYFQNEEQNLTD